MTSSAEQRCASHTWRLMAYRVRRYRHGVPEDVVFDPGRPRGSKLSDRWRAALAALRARSEARRALREERRALLRLGEALASTTAPAGDGLRGALEEVARQDSTIATMQGAASATLQEDRADYALASPWVRPLVVARGLAARCVVRDRLRQVRNERAAACRRLGAAALEQSLAISGEAARMAVAARDARIRAVTAGVRVVRATGPSWSLLGRAGSAGPAVLLLDEAPGAVIDLNGAERLDDLLDALCRQADRS